MFELSRTERELLPSDDDVEFYQQHGWYVSPRLLTDEAVDDALAALEAHHRRERDYTLPGAIDELYDWAPGAAHQVRFNDYVALTNRRLREFMLRPILGAIAARLAQTTQIRLWQSSIVDKQPQTADGDTSIGWHTDRAYWRSCTSTKMLTAWIALQDCEESMGPVIMIDGSHRWPDTEDVRALRFGRTFFGADPALLQDRLERTGMPLRFVPLLLRKGQVSFHNCLTVHGSGPNLSRQARIGATVDMQDHLNRYQRVFDESGELQSYANDRMCRKLPNGDVDYSDPEICPVLWDSQSALVR
ncbi:phytanoyl-CoA dioxygenase family protein [Nocardia cyriacigeorgica]|uniref:phytanoyl-CoA dioxygenase family protein n=1 Tax=Nocardia cyriacigeorgica TaxID=135487 RepID=UPI001892EFBA|nr:phytanoyl-CoA dioxygenase family protein [Nocardia cyriacigeorgica]MBF6416326.1 phytanoyl-CoA dioxygenase family protein [Nocardia cyriacigeorgica]